MSKQFIIKHEDGSIEVVGNEQQFMDIIRDKQTAPAMPQFLDTETGWLEDIEGGATIHA